MKKNNLIALVPARIGSNRVKVKNLRLLNGKPLIEYVIDTLKKTKYLNEIYINSDSDYFKIIAKKNEVNFYKRDSRLATSDSLIDDYIYDFIKNKKPDYLAIINPTSPFISAEELDSAWIYFKQNKFDTLLSCERIQTHCFFKGVAINFSTSQKHPRSQDLEPVFALNFAITIYDCLKYVENYAKNEYGVYTGKLGFYETENFAKVDIDYEEDFIFAEFVARFLSSQQTFKPEYPEFIQNLIKNNLETEN